MNFSSTPYDSNGINGILEILDIVVIFVWIIS